VIRGVPVLVALLGVAPASAYAATRTPTPAPAATNAPEYGVRAALSGQTTLNHNHFTYALPAGGASVADAIVVSNDTDAPLSFAVHGADMVPATGGGMAPAAEGAPATQVGGWVTVSQPAITVPPHREVSDPFTVNVPTTQQAGEFFGAVVVARSAASSGGLQLLTRAALTVDVVVIPKAELKASTGPLTSTRQRDGEHFSVEVDNPGNVLFDFSGEVTVRDGSGQVVATVPLDPAGLYVIPGGRATVAGTWSGLPLWGSVSAVATIHAKVTGGPSATATSDTLHLGYLPWALLAGGGAGLVAALVALGVFRRRRRQAA
jgi:hypothetical protein